MVILAPKTINRKQRTQATGGIGRLFVDMERDTPFGKVHFEPNTAELRQDAATYLSNTNAEQLFDKITSWMHLIRDDSQPSKSNIVAKELQETLIRAIYGSNRIEHAGLGWETTQVLCREVFENDRNVTWVYEEHEEVAKQEALGQIGFLQPDVARQPRRAALRARNEIVQHAKAYPH